MEILGRLAIALATLSSAGCVGRVVNQAEVYKPVSGIVQMEIKLPAGESVAKVQFQVNDKVISEDDTPSDGYSAEVDTAGLEPETLAKLAAVGVRADGSTVVLRENFILIARPAEEELEETTDLEPVEGEDVTPADEGAVGAFKASKPVKAKT